MLSHERYHNRPLVTLNRLQTLDDRNMIAVLTGVVPDDAVGTRRRNDGIVKTLSHAGQYYLRLVCRPKHEKKDSSNLYEKLIFVIGYAREHAEFVKIMEGVRNQLNLSTVLIREEDGRYRFHSRTPLGKDATDGDIPPDMELISRLLYRGPDSPEYYFFVNGRPNDYFNMANSGTYAHMGYASYKQRLIALSGAE